ncbi:hypothetical protein HRI_002218700 [Hibiscus trionum]|uniref:Uncharacterized protein n=1 Tax=Hibiscus trionum TaxID=183268 RepID=A0A9W7HXL1_HIBTR|nr:hypothetical protein HRI_002218700 [Hibiscus trionum]
MSEMDIGMEMKRQSSELNSTLLDNFNIAADFSLQHHQPIDGGRERTCFGRKQEEKSNGTVDCVIAEN